jgi:FkbM family methyltransferase
VPGSNSEYRQGRRFILCDLICDQNLLNTPLVVADAGALDAFAGSRWTKLPADKVRVHGFEPDVAECERLNSTAAKSGLDFRFHPVALARQSGPVEFYRYVEPAANSFYPPNERLIRRWCYGRASTFESQFKVLDRGSFDAVSLADWASANSVTDVDFIKLNVQGAELDILEGIDPAMLRGAIGLLVEQTFNETYVGAPLFGEVYEFLRKAGFCMFNIVGMNRVARTRSPIHITEDLIFVVDGTWPLHQMLEGHFFYVRDPIAESDSWDETVAMSLDKCVKLACLAEMFGQIEYAFEILDWIARSPKAGDFGVRCSEIIAQGARLYRRVSEPNGGAKADPTPAPIEPRPQPPSDYLELLNLYEVAAAENNELRADLRRIRDSRSWQLTQPVRALLSWMKKFG